ncbi:MAG: 4Fe-4S dicluster domain-containing protein [Bacillota bacterium]
MILGGKNKADSGFMQDIVRASGQETLSHCYQCGKCTAGCPAAFDMDYKPNQVIRLLQLGLKEQVLASRAIWVCAGCWTCSTRCPCNIGIAQVMDSLRIIARKEGTAGKGKSVIMFNDLFLQSVRRNGRVFELGVLLSHNFKSGKPFRDAELGRFMLSKGKLRLSAEKIKGTKVIRKLFSRPEKSPAESSGERVKE